MIKAISLADAITELQPPQHWRIGKSGQPNISYRHALRSWFALPSGKRTSVRTCSGEQFRQFISQCLEAAEGQEISDIGAIKAVLHGLNLDGFARWWIIDTLLAEGVAVPLFATERSA